MNTRFIALLLFITLPLGPGMARGAPPASFGNTEALPPLPDQITIRSAASIALKRNPTIREAREKIHETEIQIGYAKSLLYPNVAALMAGNYKKDATNFPALARFNGEPYNQYLFDLKLSETVYFGIGSALNLPKKDKELAEIALETSSRDLTSRVISSFYKVILDQKLLEALLQTENVHRESLATAQRRHRIGRGQLLDVLQAKTQLALLSPRIAQARTLIQTDAALLASLLGNQEAKEIRLKGDLVTLPLPAIEARMKGKIGKFPELAKVELSQERLQYDRDVTLGKDLPNLAATLDWTRSAFAKADLLDNSSNAWTFGLQLTIPIFSGLSSLQQRRIYASRNTQLELEQENEKNTLSLQQIQSKKNLALSWETIASTQEAFNIAGASLKEAKKNYQLATIDFLQYLSVQQAYLEAKSSLFQAEFNYISSLVSHFVASGLPLGNLIDLLEEKS